MKNHSKIQKRLISCGKYLNFALLFIGFGVCLICSPKAFALPRESDQAPRQGAITWETLKASTLGRTQGGSLGLSLPRATTAKIRSSSGRNSWETTLRRAATRLTIMTEYVRKDWELSSADAGRFLRRTFSLGSPEYPSSSSGLSGLGGRRGSFAGLGSMCGETLGEAYRYLSLLSDNIASVTAQPLTLALVKGDYQGALDTLEGMSVELEKRSREALR